MKDELCARCADPLDINKAHSCGWGAHTSGELGKISIKQKLEQKIRNNYKGLISDGQIEATIKWWNDLLDLAIAGRDKEWKYHLDSMVENHAGKTPEEAIRDVVQLLINSKK